MEWQITLAETVALALFAAFCGWRGARLPDPIRGARMVPWRFLMVLSVFGVLLLVVHLLNLLGFATGDAHKSGG